MLADVEFNRWAVYWVLVQGNCANRVEIVLKREVSCPIRVCRFRCRAERAKLAPLKGKPIIVHIVVNVEYWPFDQPMPRKVLSTPHGVDRIPDIPNYSWAEYGLRSGMPRMMKLFGQNNLPVSVNINAAVIDVYPSFAKADARCRLGVHLSRHDAAAAACRERRGRDDPAPVSARSRSS